MSILLFGLAAVHARARREKAERHANRLTTVGMEVLVTLDDGIAYPRTLTALPWQFGSDDWVCGVSGISGGYCCARVIPA